jgi:hypothetical protein
LRAIAGGFPADFSGAIFVVARIGQSRSTVPDLLGKAGKLSASHPQQEEPIRGSHLCSASRSPSADRGRQGLLVPRSPRTFHQAGD